VASPVGHQVLRVLEGGEVTDRIAVENEAFACMLGGPERRDLLVCTAGTSDPKESHVRSGRIEVARVEIPGAGLP
jgi:sugar lactone lactonase YvrE